MKKFRRVMLAAAAVCVGLGAVLSGIGAAAGGTLEDLDLDIRMPWKQPNSLQKEFPGVVSLDFEIRAARVEIREGEEFALDDGGVSCWEFDSRVENGVWHVNITGGWDGDFDPDRDRDRTLVITVPAGCRFREADIDLKAGSLTVEGLSAERADIELSAGELRAESLAAGRCDLECGAGSLQIAGLETSDLSVKCGAGAVTLWMTGAEEEYSVRGEVGLGDIVIGTQSVSGVSREYFREGGTKRVDIDCGMGSVSLSFAGEGV